MWVERFFLQKCALERRLGTDGYTGNTYGIPTEIRVRWYNEVNVVRSETDREVTSDAYVSTESVIRAGDRITDEDGRKREVVIVRRNRNTRGEFSHFVGYLA
jgi:hypothetical protein